MKYSFTKYLNGNDFRDEWRGYVPPYAPRFSNGWAPGPSVVEELGHTMDRRDYRPPSRGVRI